MDSFLLQLLKIRLDTLKLRLEYRDFLTGAPLKNDTLTPEELAKIEWEIKEITAQLKLADIENDF